MRDEELKHRFDSLEADILERVQSLEARMEELEKGQNGKSETSAMRDDFRLTLDEALRQGRPDVLADTLFENLPVRHRQDALRGLVQFLLPMAIEAERIASVEDAERFRKTITAMALDLIRVTRPGS
jgi:hypothetical protein